MVSILLLAASPLLSGVAHAQEDPFGHWSPPPGEPLTQPVSAEIRSHGSLCMEETIKKGKIGRYGITGKVEEADIGKPHANPTFIACMETRGWVRVSREVFQARLIEGQAEECLQGTGLATGCAEVVNQYVHGMPDSGLDQLRGLAIGKQLCESGDGEVCLIMASLYLHSSEVAGLPRQPRLSLEYAQKGCEVGFADACGFAGMLLKTDHKGITQDQSAGDGFLREACERGNLSACERPDPPDTSLPDAFMWCEYGLVTQTDSPDCPVQQVMWMSAAPETECKLQVVSSTGKGHCVYQYELGAAQR